MDHRFITDGFHFQVALQRLNAIVDSLCFHEPLVKCRDRGPAVDAQKGKETVAHD
jgi:hypothetical protein